MVKYENEEHLKDLIFDIFSNCQDELSSDRRQVHFARLCELIYKWCQDFQFRKEIDNMGKEIVNVTRRIMKDRTIKNVPHDKNDFFSYLRKALNTEKLAFYRNDEHDDSRSIKIPKEKKVKIKKIMELLLMQESNAGRILTKNEQLSCILEWFGNIQEYNDIINAMRIGRLEFTHNNDDEIDNLNSSATPIYMGNISMNPLNELLLKEYKEIVCNAIDTMLKRKQERSRDCYRALFTVYCIKRWKGWEMLYSALDAKILNSWRNEDKIPSQGEIYLEYHQNAKAPEVSASTVIRNFFNELNEYLIENHPEILF